MKTALRIGTRDSQLAVWQATLVKNVLEENKVACELVYIKSEGDIDLKTPLYEIGVQGIFTRTLDIALLSNKIDIAVHSMKDVPTQPAKSITQAAVLPRASYKDIFVYKGNDEELFAELGFINNQWLSDEALHQQRMHNSQSKSLQVTIATSSVRRKAQWLHRYRHHSIDNLRGNVNTRLQKVQTNNWNGAIFAAAGLERINLRPITSLNLDWMLPAPAQGAIMVVTREGEQSILDDCSVLHDRETAICVAQERNFLRGLMGGCTTPISALATISDNMLFFKGNLLSKNGLKKITTEKSFPLSATLNAGIICAEDILNNGGDEIITQL